MTSNTLKLKCLRASLVFVLIIAFVSSTSFCSKMLTRVVNAEIVAVIVDNHSTEAGKTRLMVVYEFSGETTFTSGQNVVLTLNDPRNNRSWVGTTTMYKVSAGDYSNGVTRNVISE